MVVKFKNGKAVSAFPFLNLCLEDIDNWGFQWGCPPLLQWGDEDVYTVRRGASPFCFLVVLLTGI